jgi:thioesterase domain-containing protein/aryl carrier-like protein
MDSIALESGSNNSSNSANVATKSPVSDFWLTARTNARLKQQAPPIQPVPRNGFLPLSLNQERLWLLDQWQSDSSVHNLLHTFHFQGNLNLTALENSLSELVRRHESLRTGFTQQDEQPMQWIAPAIPVQLSVVDLQSLSAAQQQTTMAQLMQAEVEQRFDLSRVPLWRFKLLRLGTEEHVLLRVVHHIVFDGWSHNVFLRELGVLYKAFCAEQASPLPELPIQYADFAHAQRQWLAGQAFATQLQYWQQHLGGSVAALELPTDYPRPLLPSYAGERRSLVVSPELTKALKTLSAQQGVSLFATLLAAFKTLLYCYTQQEDMLICSPVASRQRLDIKGLLGYFNNLVVLRTDLSADPSFRELVRRVSQMTLGAYANQEVPLQTLAEFPNLARTPLTRAMVVLQNVPNPAIALDGLTLKSEFIERNIANFDLSLSMEEKDGQLVGGLQYKTDLFSAATIAHLLEQFQSLLQTLVANPDLHLSELPVLGTSGNSGNLAATQTDSFVAPRTEVEVQLQRIWQLVLDRPAIGVQDNFFELGGHSLLAVSLMLQVKQVFGQDLPLSTLVTAPTIEAMAALLSQAEDTATSDSLVLLKQGGAAPPIFFLHDGDGETLLYRTLAYFLNPEHPVYGIQPLSRKNHPILHARIPDMAAYYIEQIRSVQPDGPYFLSGLCAGGVLAFEVACQLQRQGQTVAMVGIIDAADVDATLRSGLIAGERLSSFSQALSQQQQGNLGNRLFQIARKATQKIGNLVAYEVQTRIKKTQDAVKMRLFRYCLDRGWSLPPVLHHIPVRTAFMFAEQDYTPQDPYQGEIILFRATDGDGDDEPYIYRYSDPLLGWGKRATESVRVYDIPGGHGSVLQAPNVEVMAEHMQAYITAALCRNPATANSARVGASVV